MRRSGQSWGRELALPYPGSITERGRISAGGSKSDPRAQALVAKPADCTTFETGAPGYFQKKSLSKKEGFSHNPSDGIALNGRKAMVERPKSVGSQGPAQKATVTSRVGVRTRFRRKASRVGISAVFSRNTVAGRSWSRVL